MIRFFKLVALFAVLAALAGCNANRTSPLGSSKLVGGGPLPQALIFQVDMALKEGLTREEQHQIAASELRALEYGESGQGILWSGGRPEVSGSIVAFQLYRVGSSSCRRFEHKMKRKGKNRKAIGTACKRNDERWKLVT